MGAEQSSRSDARGGGGGGTPLSPSAAFDPLAALSRDAAAGGGGGAAAAGRVDRLDSVASDVESSAEVPYVSYTVNRPIGGDSPKKHKKKAAAAAAAETRRPHHHPRGTMVTVSSDPSSSSSSAPNSEQDPELLRLREIPSFLPVMRASLSGSGAKDPDILERLDFRGLSSMALRYEAFLRRSAEEVSARQAEIGRAVRRADGAAQRAAQGLQDRQKKYAKCQESLRGVSEVARSLARCHLLLNENIEQMEALNNLLPPEERLEPFVWTTG